MIARRYISRSGLTSLALLTASFLFGLSAEATTPPVPHAFDGVSLPYDGPGSLWVLDDGNIVVEVNPRPPGTADFFALNAVVLEPAD